jgi:hypothetical protein
MKPKSYRILLKSIVLALLFNLSLHQGQYLLPAPLVQQLMEADGNSGPTLIFHVWATVILMSVLVGKYAFAFINAFVPDKKA